MEPNGFIAWNAVFPLSVFALKLPACPALRPHLNLLSQTSKICFLLFFGGEITSKNALHFCRLFNKRYLQIKIPLHMGKKAPGVDRTVGLVSMEVRRTENPHKPSFTTSRLRYSVFFMNGKLLS